MNHLEFAPYHNRHIVFRLKNGNEKSGVVLDTMSFDENNQYKTKYKFITTVNLVSWTKAKKEGNLIKWLD
jgi:hypothetical protein